MKDLTVVIVVTILCLSACVQQKAPEKEADKEATVQQPEFYNPISKYKLIALYQKADQYDVIFNDLPVSISQNEKKAIQGSVAMLTPGRVPRQLNCPETGTMIFQAEGEVIADGRFYVTDDCHYVVFYEDDQPSYSAKLNEQGMHFFRQVMEQTFQ